MAVFIGFPQIQKKKLGLFYKFVLLRLWGAAHALVAIVGGYFTSFGPTSFSPDHVPVLFF
jgi:hypothetical protein